MPSANAKVTDAPARSMHPTMSKADEADLNAIHATIGRMQELTLPDPYIVTIPQDVEPRYHHSYRYQEWQWLDHTPFKAREGEMIQYQTFHYHEHGADMYVLLNSRLAEDAREEEGSKAASRTQTAGNTPNGTAPKKKITLDAYKKKQAGTPLPSSSQDKPKENIPRSVTTPLDQEANQLKRKREHDRAEQEKRKSNLEEGDLLAKKRRTSDSPIEKSKQDKSSSRNQQHVKSPARPSTPPYESSRLPPKLSPLEVPSLPSRLSPTIPSNIKATLRERELSKSSEALGSENAIDSGKRSSHEKLEAIAKQRSPAPTNGVGTASKSPVRRKNADERHESKLSAAARSTTSPEPSQDDVIAVRKVDKSQKSASALPIVKLTYKKHQREPIRRILNMRPRPERFDVASKDDESSSDEQPLKSIQKGSVQDGSTRGPAHKAASSKKNEDNEGLERRSSEKRPASDQATEAERSAKRQKSSKGEPSTPVQRDVDSTSVQSSTQRNQPITPTVRKDHLSAARRTSLVDSPTIDSGTPAVASQSNGQTKSALSQSTKTPMQDAWERKQKQLEALGRELKHSSTASLNKSQSEPSKSKTEQKLAAVKSVESLISYLLAFSCADQASLTADPKQAPSVQTWRSLRGFYGFVKKNCEPFNHLTGLACWLGAVSFSHILNLSSQHPSEGPSRETILDLHGLMQRAASQGEANLDLDELMSVFPRTWKQRARGAVSTTLESPTKLGGKFKIPIGVQTQPIQAARAGYAMLEEWIAEEKLDYSLRLKETLKT